MTYQLCVIGAGSGGYSAAIKAAQLGAKVILIEKDNLGGVCMNKGCIPTKTLLKSAEKWQEVQNIKEFGVFVERAGYDWEKVMERKNNVVYQMRKGLEKLIKLNKIELAVGKVRFISKNTIRLITDNPDQERNITAEKIIIATGSEPFVPPIPGADLAGVITSDDVLQLDEVPGSMVIVGAGAVGVEFAGIYAGFGCMITIVEMASAILPLCDVDMQKRMGLSLRKQHITAKTGAAVKAVTRGSNGLSVTIEYKGKEEIIEAEKVLLAVGRKPVFASEELDEIGISYTRKGIVVNEKMETSVQGIYAVGDVTGLSMLAHSASHQGLIAAVNAVGDGEAVMHYNAIPSCIFTQPEIAQVGMTEQECEKNGRKIVTSKFNFMANGKAVSMSETEGLVKLIADSQTHKLIGVHIMGAHASDLIAEGIVAVQNGLTAEEIAACIHPHPTLSEAVGEAAMGLFGNMIHQINMKR
ncbi:MAG: dihydrolipoyl dehydrogenase [Acidaminococcaceae bacterium]|nr:dihydrolipoyl dehydrogenase [Acidaminococcaceae bacterium]